MRTEKFMTQYKNARLKIRSGLDEMAALRAMAERCTVEFAESGNLPAKEVGALVAQIVDLEMGIARRIKELERIRDGVLKAIAGVDDERLRDVLSLRYINGMTWERIATELGYSRQWVYALHRRALEAVRFDGKE